MYIYKLLNENGEVIYIGKTINIRKRMISHFEQNLEEWKSSVTFIEFAKLPDGATMEIYEIYYIDKIKPKFNKQSKYETTSKIILEELTFTKMSISNYKNFVEIKNIKKRDEVLGYNMICQSNIKKISEFNKEELLDRYVIYIPKDYNFIKCCKNTSNIDVDFIKNKIFNVQKHLLNCSLKELVYTIHPIFLLEIFKIKRIPKRRYTHFQESKDGFFLAYLSDFNDEELRCFDKNSSLCNLLNFMTINTKTDTNGKTYLLLVTEQNFKFIYEYFDKKIEVRFC